ncbi:glycosyltransferase family 39 protein [Spirosoma fluminis]
MNSEAYSLVTHVPRYFTRKGITAFVAITVLTIVLFFHRIIPIPSLVFNLVEVIFFFRLTSTLSVRWADLSTLTFTKRLTKVAFAIRLAWVVFSYFYYQVTTGQPFEFQSADSLGYHNEAIWLAGLLKDNKWPVYVAYIGKNYSDLGYPTYLGILYYAFGDYVLIPRLIKVLLGSLTCLLVYKIGKNNFGESTGRMAGIMAMLVPNLIYYCGLHVKETEMVFLTVWFVYLGDKLIRNRKIKAGDLSHLFLIGALLFLFRTVLAACLIGSLGLATLLTSRQVSILSRRVSLLMVLAVASLLIVITPVGDNITEYLHASDQSQTKQMWSFSVREGANKLAHHGSRGVFLPFMLMAPFPTLVYIYDQQNTMMLGGAYFTRNVYAFFVFVALFILYKRKQLKGHVLLLAVIFSYVFVLASSGFALSERFHLPLVPFLLVLASYGVSQMNLQNRRYYVPYLILIGLLVIGWNWFKLAGRS